MRPDLVRGVRAFLDGFMYPVLFLLNGYVVLTATWPIAALAVVSSPWILWRIVSILKSQMNP